MSAYDDLQERLKQIARESGEQFRISASETVKMVVPQNRAEDHIYRRSWLRIVRQLDGKSYDLSSIEAHDDPRVPVILHFPNIAEHQKFSEILNSGLIENRASELRDACNAYLENKQPPPEGAHFNLEALACIVKDPVPMVAANEQ